MRGESTGARGATRAGKRGLERETANAAEAPHHMSPNECGDAVADAAATVQSFTPLPVGAGGIRRVCSPCGSLVSCRPGAACVAWWTAETSDRRWTESAA